jgi:sortase B
MAQKIRNFLSKSKKESDRIKKLNKKSWLIICIISATVAVSAALWLLSADNSEEPFADDIKLYTAPVSLSQPGAMQIPTPEPKPRPEPKPEPEPETTPEPDIYDDGIRETDREIDFEAYSERNPDFFAWIYVPGTNIDYPVVKSHDNFDYVRRDIDGRNFTGGTVFMDMGNHLDLSDRITVLHGHNMRNGTKFADLHKFRDPEFFASNREIKLYTTEGMRIYEIVAAYIRDDRNILYMVDYSIDEVWQAYIEEIFSNTDEAANLFRVEIGNGDQMLTLKTCVRGQDTNRFLVQGILKRQNIQENTG